MKLKYMMMLAPLVFAGACSDDDTTTGPSENYVTVEKSVTLDAGQQFQTIEGFGASDCWAPSYIGKYWSTHRDAISELLFSQQKGIGLSMWRVNLGGGSAAQGDASGIEDPSRRAESYLKDDGTYDWNRCEGQRYFLSRAKELGCEDIVLFSNTPPVQYTYNGKGYSNRGGVSNLKSEYYDDFAAYMAEVAKHYLDEGYPVSYISPVNEPQHNWASGQEGSAWTNDEVARLVRELDGELTSRSLASVNILLGESADWEYLYKSKSDANRSNVLKAFFDASSSAYVGGLDHVEPMIGGHSYWTDGAWDAMRNVRKTAGDAAAGYGVRLWQTEWSMLGDNYSSEFPGYGVASQMDIALYMSKVIHNDLVMANVTSWSYWTAIDLPRYGHQNRFLLISVMPAGGEEGDLSGEGSFEAARTLWVLGNYSRFIRPGYRRIALDVPFESRNFFGSAWISPEADQIVAIYTNLSEKGVRLDETRENLGGEVKSIVKYTTSAGLDLQEAVVPMDGAVELAPMSVTTVVYNLQ